MSAPTDVWPSYDAAARKIEAAVLAGGRPSSQDLETMADCQEAAIAARTASFSADWVPAPHAPGRLRKRNASDTRWLYKEASEQATGQKQAESSFEVGDGRRLSYSRRNRKGQYDGWQDWVLKNGRKIVGRIGGSVKDEKGMSASSGEEHHLSVTKTYTDDDLHGTGAFQWFAQKVANQYKGGFKSEKFQSSRALHGAIRKMPTHHEDGHDLWVRPSSPSGVAPTYQPGKVYDVPLTDVHVDPARFQYKLGVDAAGVTPELSQVRTWNPDFAGVVLAWPDPEQDDKLFAVNGHHRRELASRLGVRSLAVRVLEAPDATSARAVGALVNVAEGRGTAIDAANFMRQYRVDAAALEQRGVSLKGSMAHDAQSLSSLSERSFARVVLGSLGVNRALDVARHLGNPERQDLLFDLLERRETSGAAIPPRVVEEMAREMAISPEGHQPIQKDLFGGSSLAEPLFVPRAEIKSYVRAALAQEANDYAAVASTRRAERLAGTGNVLAVESNRQSAQRASRLSEIFHLLGNRTGPISEAINAAAVALAEAPNRSRRDEVRRAALADVRAACQRELDGTRPPVRSGLGAEPGGSHPGGLFPDA